MSEAYRRFRTELEQRADETITQRRQAKLAEIERATAGMTKAEKEAYLCALPHSDNKVRP
jgi:hypothetical protein